DETGIAGSADADDRSAAALAVGDFDGDGRDDLAIGVPGEDVGSVNDAGAVNVIYGYDAAGLNAAGDQIWDQDKTGIEGAAETGDDRSGAVSAGDVDDDGRD